MSSILTQDTYDNIVSGYNPEANTSKNIMSRYEKAKVIGLRLQQLAAGAEPTIDVKSFSKNVDLRTIALEELKQRKLPFMLLRNLPLGVKEYWKLEDLVLPA
jgi:DNA-directed RNA polymerase subunit K/omega